MTTTTFPKIDTQESFFTLVFNRKVGTVMINLTTCFRHNDITKTLSRVTAISFSRQNDAGSRALYLLLRKSRTRSRPRLGIWRSLIATTRTTFAFVCLFACICDGPSMRAWQVSKGKRTWRKGTHGYLRAPFLVPFLWELLTCTLWWS